MNNRYQLIELFDLYSSLLSPTQHKMFIEYYHHDYSMEEIAQMHKISRSGVYDSIAKAKKQLQYYESKLHLIIKMKKREQLICQLKTSIIKNQLLKLEKR